MTAITTIEDSETGVNAEVSRLEERLAILKKMQAGTATQVSPSAMDKTYDHDGILVELSDMEHHDVTRPQKSMMGHRKRKDNHCTADALTLKTPSFASSSPKQKKQRKDNASPDPHKQPDDNQSTVSEECFTDYLWDHEFNFENMRND